MGWKQFKKDVNKGLKSKEFKAVTKEIAKDAKGIKSGVVRVGNAAVKTIEQVPKLADSLANGFSIPIIILGLAGLYVLNEMRKNRK